MMRPSHLLGWMMLFAVVSSTSFFSSSPSHRHCYRRCNNNNHVDYDRPMTPRRIDDCDDGHSFDGAYSTTLLRRDGKTDDHLPRRRRRRNTRSSLLLSTRGGGANNGDDDNLLHSILLTNHRNKNSTNNSVRRESKAASQFIATNHNKSSNASGTTSSYYTYNNKHRSTKSRHHPQLQPKHQQSKQHHNNIPPLDKKQLLSNLATSMQYAHTSTIQALIKGNAAHISPVLFGQTLLQERVAAAACYYSVESGVVESAMRNQSGQQQQQQQHQQNHDDDDDDDASSGSGDTIEKSSTTTTGYSTFQHIDDTNLLSQWGLTPNAKLYGGAQYHRVLRYYHHLFLTVPLLPSITEDEIALLTDGITDVHDASDLMRAVALLVQSRLELIMEDVLADMTRRLLYVMERQWELVEYSMTLHRPMGGSPIAGSHGINSSRHYESNFLYSLYGSEFTMAEQDIMDVLSISFHKFAAERAEDAHTKSVEDVKSLLRYVTWDMGRARTRRNNAGNVMSDYQNSDGGFVTQVEIVRDEQYNTDDFLVVSVNGQRADDFDEENTRNRSSSSRKQKQTNKKSTYSESTRRRMIARGGAAIGSGRKRSQLRRMDEFDDNPSVATNAGGADQDDTHVEDNDAELEDNSTSTSLVLTSQTSPMFSGDDEVLSLLLDTLSSTLVPKSDTKAGQTRAAIENLASYITDRMRLDISRMIRSKFNTFFLLPFYEDLGAYLRRELDSYLASLDG